MKVFKKFSRAVEASKFISGIGLLLLTGLLAWASFIFEGSSTVLLIEFMIIGIPSLILVYGGHWLAKADIRKDTHMHVARWCTIGIVALNGILALLLLAGNPESFISVLEDILLVTGVGGAGGFGIGINQARALTKASEAEEQNQKLKRYETLIKESVNVNAVLDTKGVFQYLTPSTENVLGYSPEELEGEQVFPYIHPEDIEEVEKSFAAAVEGGKVGPIEFRFKHKEGSWIVLSGKSRNLLEDPAIGGIVAYTHDITERKKLEKELKETVEKLEESNEELEQFAYVASHDLKEPARTVKGYLDLLENKHSDELNSDAQELIDYAARGSERMQRMIDDLLEYSRLTTDTREFEKLDLNVVLDQVIENLNTKIEEENAKVDVEELPNIHGDRTQLIQLFQNLIENSIKYSGDQPPKIEIYSEESGSENIISVEDNGTGIESGKQEEVFEIFHSLQTGEDKGTGIGLASVKKIVERHGGEIWVESEPGEGSTFHFTLPR